ncbi:hypothetical protein HY570_03510 [Candidatus Micrarchaeota archaeon]|nr:hypothetical protein [Candidatus Micrarchaeota archaeon]
MSDQLYPTYEVGSLAKPVWHVKKLRNLPITPKDTEELNYWTNKLGLNLESKLSALLNEELTEQLKHKIKDYSSQFAIRLFENVGLDYVYNGEQWRTEMYEGAIRFINGFKFYGEVRSFDNKYYLKAACVEKPSLAKPYHTEEFIHVKGVAKRKTKVPITGAYTLADWSFNEHYSLQRANDPDVKKARQENKRDLTLDLAREVLRPTIKDLIENGAEWIQIDEPAATTKPDEVDLLVESFNESVKGLNAKFSIHICFSDYSLLFPEVLEMKQCSHFSLEFANRDNPRQDGYKDLNLFNEYNDRREIGLGVLNVHVDDVESPATVKERILRATKILGDPKRIYPAPDCGLRTRSWHVVYQKLENMVKGTQEARKELGG